MNRRTVVVMCRPAAAVGFRLASLATHVVADAHEAARELARLRQRDQVGVVLIEDTLETALHELGAKWAGLPVLVPFPGPAWDTAEDAAEARVLELLRRAIGYRVRLR